MVCYIIADKIKKTKVNDEVMDEVKEDEKKLC
jgi:hypothetical protein